MRHNFATAKLMICVGVTVTEGARKARITRFILHACKVELEKEKVLRIFRSLQIFLLKISRLLN